MSHTDNLFHLAKTLMPRSGLLNSIVPEGGFVLRPLLFHTDLFGILNVYADGFGRLPPVKPMRRALMKHRWLLVCSVQKDGAPIVGFMVFAVSKKRRQIKILRIAVLKSFRRRGLATAVLKDLLRHAKGYDVVACVGEKNLAALELFKKLGFRSRLVRRPNDDYDEIVFYRPAEVDDGQNIQVSNG